MARVIHSTNITVVPRYDPGVTAASYANAHLAKARVLYASMCRAESTSACTAAHRSALAHEGLRIGRAVFVPANCLLRATVLRHFAGTIVGHVDESWDTSTSGTRSHAGGMHRA